MKRGTEIKKAVKRIAVAGLVGCLLYNSSIGIYAATLKDIFDEKYYADNNADLKTAFGYDREALWNHFLEYGLSEGRQMNALIDVVKYRELYPDLNAAFGDDWDAYLNHYLTYGALEGRDSGTRFNALDYAGRYSDLQAAYGNDILALYNHYVTYGLKENREARAESVIAAERAAEAARWAAVSDGSSASSPAVESFGSGLCSGEASGTETFGGDSKVFYHEDGSYHINYYADSRLVKQLQYDTNGNMRYCIELRWNEADRLEKETYYDGNGNIKYEAEYNNGQIVQAIAYFHDEKGNMTGYGEFRYNEAGSWEKETYYDANGKMTGYTEWKYNDAGQQVEDTSYDENGKKTGHSEWEYNEAGNVKKFTSYDENDKKTGHNEWEYNEAGKREKVTFYDADGKKTGSTTYEYSEDSQTVTRTTYDADGKQIGESEIVADVVSAVGPHHLLGPVIITGYQVQERNGDGDLVKSTAYNANGNITYEDEYSDGQMVKSTSFSYDANDSVAGSTVGEYGEDGEPEKITSYDENGSMVSCTEYEYSEDGQTVKRTSYGADGSITYEAEFNDGQQVKSTSYSYDENGGMTGYTVNEYGKSEEVINSASYDADGNLMDAGDDN